MSNGKKSLIEIVSEKCPFKKGEIKWDEDFPSLRYIECKHVDYCGANDCCILSEFNAWKHRTENHMFMISPCKMIMKIYNNETNAYENLLTHAIFGSHSLNRIHRLDFEKCLESMFGKSIKEWNNDISAMKLIIKNMEG